MVIFSKSLQQGNQEADMQPAQINNHL